MGTMLYLTNRKRQNNHKNGADIPLDAMNRHRTIGFGRHDRAQQSARAIAGVSYMSISLTYDARTGLDCSTAPLQNPTTTQGQTPSSSWGKKNLGTRRAVGETAHSLFGFSH